MNLFHFVSYLYSSLFSALCWRNKDLYISEKKELRLKWEKRGYGHLKKKELRFYPLLEQFCGFNDVESLLHKPLYDEKNKFRA